MTKKVVLILSGGLDSTTLLYDLLDREDTEVVAALTFDYNQRHKKEIEFAKKTCEVLGVNQQIISIPFFREIADSSSLTGDVPVPEGRYDEPSMKSTVVHNRNMVLLSIAASFALNHGATSVYYGAHAGDHTIYPDCRPEFVAAMKAAFRVCDWESLVLRVPYLMKTKAEIVARGLELGVDYSLTWTCYKGETYPCGKCGSCTERLEAFALAGATDPLEYME